MTINRTASAVLVAVLVLAPGLAHADVAKHHDPSGDVQYFVNSDPAHVPPPTPAPGRTQGDITGVRVSHGKRFVRVVTYFRSLPRTGQFHGHVYRLVTGAVVRKAQIAAGPEAPRGWKGYSEMFTTSDRKVTCRGLSHRIDYAHRRVILDVPRSCLRTPKSVRVAVGTVILDHDRTYFDDGYRTRGTLGMEALRPTLGPAVAR